MIGCDIYHVIINVFTFIVFQLLLRTPFPPPPTTIFVQNLGFPEYRKLPSCRKKFKKELIYNLSFVFTKLQIKLVANNSISYLYKFDYKFKQCMHIYKFTQQCN